MNRRRFFAAPLALLAPKAAQIAPRTATGAMAMKLFAERFFAERGMVFYRFNYAAALRRGWLTKWQVRSLGAP